MNNIKQVIYGFNKNRNSCNKKFTKNSSKKLFNNARWRSLLNEVCKEIDIEQFGLKAISPFGFELLEDKTYLMHQLRRFYAYIGVPKHLVIDKNRIAADFKTVLFQKLLKQDAEMLSDIVLVIENEQLKKLRAEDYICKRTDKILDIQVRLTEDNILTDYTHYLITLLSGLYHQKAETKEFEINKRYRWRFYQLYIIQEKIFGHLIPCMSTPEYNIYNRIFKILSNMI